MTKRICNLKAKKAFTLVELIVVIAIIAILTAVIVPIVAHYSAQARYTTLQDAASVISNSSNNAMSDGNQVSAINISEITGKKTGGVLEITLGGATAQDDGAGSVTVTVAGGDGENRAAERLCTSLATTLPDECAFYVSVRQSAVEGVIYTAANSTIPSGTESIIPVDGFEDAYAYNDGSGSPVGVSGKYIPS